MRIRAFLFYFFGLILPPMVVGTLLTFSTLTSLMIHSDPAPLDLSRPKIESVLPPALTFRTKAAILLGNEGTQITELLTAMEVLGASGKLDVFTVAPKRTLSPTTGPIAVLPHYSFDQAPPAEILVLPTVLDPTQKEAIAWLQSHAPTARWILTLGDGVKLAAQAGLLSGVQATSHFLSHPHLVKRFPQTQWKAQARTWVDGKWITSGGMAASVEASLLLLKRAFGPEVALRTARELAVPYEDLDSSKEKSKSVVRGILPTDLFDLFLRAGFDWFKDPLAIAVYPGVSELSLAAPLDTFVRSYSYHVLTLGLERTWTRTAHGLDLVPTESVPTAPQAALLVVPARGNDSADPLRNADFHRWVVNGSVPVKSFLYDQPSAALEKSLQLLSISHGPRTARFAARMLRAEEVPINEGGSSLPWKILLRPVFLALFGILLAHRLLGVFFTKRQ